MASTPPAKRAPKKKSNPLRAGQHIDYKDTATLRKFISERGKIRARRVTGLTPQQQRQVATAIRNAREMALLPYANRVTQQRGGGRGERPDRGLRAEGPPPRPTAPPPRQGEEGAAPEVAEEEVEA